MKKLLLPVLAVVVAVTAWLAYELRSRPSLARYRDIATAPAAIDDGSLRVTFLGVSTLLFRDAEAAVLIDGFFSRPDLASTVIGQIVPDGKRIDAGLALAAVDKLDAVVVVHSHYDHAMDSAEVARRTGAVVVGSESTANISRGLGLAEDRIRIVADTQTMQFGDLTVTLIPSRHFPHGKAMGDIEAPLIPPARALDYLEGGSFAVRIERGERAVLVQASAGYIEGALAGQTADVVYLGVGLLGPKDDAYRDAYWRETVTAVSARRVIPIHWDDFTRGLDRPLVALPFLLDDLDVSMDFVLSRAAGEHVDVRWPVVGVAIDPFEGL